LLVSENDRRREELYPGLPSRGKFEMVEGAGRITTLEMNHECEMKSWCDED
jgi:hypothetical protein